MAEFLWRRPALYDKQWKAIFNNAVISVVPAASKSGKTWSATIWLLERALERKGLYWWVSPVGSQSDIAFELLRDRLPRSFAKVNLTTREFRLTNGSIIKFQTGHDPDHLYGAGVTAAVVDEGSRLKKDSWTALLSTLFQTRGLVRVIGNVTSRRNWFWELAERAEQYMQDNPDANYYGELQEGEERPTYHRMSITAEDAIKAGVVRQEDLELRREEMTEQDYLALYFNIPPADGGNPFNFDKIVACTKDPINDPTTCSSKPPICYGIDLAKAVDWTVLIGLDEDGNVCRFHRWQESWDVAVPRIEQLVGDLPAMVDKTGLGDVVTDLLPNNFEGFGFTQPSRQELLADLAVAIQREEVGFPPGQIVKELERFEYVERSSGVYYASPDSVHDDCVMALALAVRMMVKGRNRKPRPLVLAGTGGSRSSPHSLGSGGKESPWF